MTSSSSESAELVLRATWTKFELGALPLSSLPDVALGLLELWPSDETIATVAGMNSGTGRALHDAFDRIGVMHDLPFLVDPRRAKELCDDLLRLIAAGGTTPKDGAFMALRLVTSSRWSDADGPQLSEIAGYAQLWDEFPEQQEEFNRRILELSEGPRPYPT